MGRELNLNTQTLETTMLKRTLWAWSVTSRLACYLRGLLFPGHCPAFFPRSTRWLSNPDLEFPSQHWLTAAGGTIQAGGDQVIAFEYLLPGTLPAGRKGGNNGPNHLVSLLFAVYLRYGLPLQKIWLVKSFFSGLYLDSLGTSSIFSSFGQSQRRPQF